MEQEPLHTIEEWVNQMIHPLALQQTTGDLQQSNEGLLFIEEQVGLLCAALVDNAHTQQGQQHIYQLQLRILGLLERVGTYMRELAQGAMHYLWPYYGRVAASLEKVMDHIRRFLPQYFQDNLEIPYSTWLKSQAQLSAALEQLEQAYTYPEVEQPLLRLALQPIRDFVTSERSSTTYRQLHYLQTLARQLSFLYDTTVQLGVKDMNWEIHTVLIQMNYNLPRYVLLCTTRLDEKLIEKSDVEKIATLQWYFRTMEQLEPLPGYCFIPTLPSVTEQIVSSLRHVHRLLIEKNVSLQATSEAAGPPYQHRIQLSVSVPVLTLFIKLCLKAGIINNQSKAEVFRITSQVFSTVKSADISVQSIRTKNKNTSLHAIKVMRQLLLRLLDLLKEE
ncbi:hypothetical protein [Chitinophaga filiformis]|uniref:Uncharacterized protein n=1 Tax=Chitinophaga filiformis TaxID=104663 RepID=A0ABY4HZW5_CHIFI|nr:hypothetical protein [Chitinophaga filiformis]UPK68036.1 hypothetical protein MYF79_24085 [Chitinophaga filiformis]